MENQKLENLLNLALDATAAEREQSPELNIGYNQSENTWDLIIKYTGNLSDILGEDVPRAELLNGFAVITLEESRIEALSRIPGIEYIEKPKRLFFAVQQGRSASCMTSVQSAFSPLGEPLTGKGILVACIDSGVDYAHPDFRDPEAHGFCGSGIRVYREDLPGAILLEQSIHRKKSIRHFWQRTGQTEKK